MSGNTSRSSLFPYTTLFRSQGTMNNVTFGGTGDGGRGTGAWTYYETIGGGQGASQGARGPSGVHVGMSNTRNTDRKSTRLNSSHRCISYAVFCLKKKHMTSK